MNVSALRSEAQRYTLLRERLLETFPDVDEDTIRDTLEGISTLDELIAEIMRSALVDQALQTGLRGRLEDMRERLGRLELREIKEARPRPRRDEQCRLEAHRGPRLYRFGAQRRPEFDRHS